MVPTPSQRLDRIAILTGPTASGKTAVAIELAERHGKIELINADSLQVYRGMDIGTAKPTPTEQHRARHHLIDICDPDQTFTAGEFCRAAEKAIADIESRGHRPLIVGGTGFYLKALLYGMWEAPAADQVVRERLSALSDPELHQKLLEIDPTAARKIGPSDRYRLVRALELFELSGKPPTQLQAEAARAPDARFELWILDRATEELEDRIRQRSTQMIEQGLIEETQRVREKYPDSRALRSVGYAQVCDYLDGRVPAGRKLKPGIAGLVDEITLATRQLVKSQRTWFRNAAFQTPSTRTFFLESDRASLDQAFQNLYG